MIEGGITISRPQCGDGSEYVSITVRDNDAVCNFLEIRMDYSEFTKAITGLSGSKCEIIPRDLHKVGKIKISEGIEFDMPDKDYFNKDVARTIAKEIAGPHWQADTYFSSQDSFFTEKGRHKARTRIVKWVDK